MAINPSSFSAQELQQYTDVPALAPPAGVTPDFTARNVRGDVYIGLCSILLAIVFVSLGLRLYAKFHIKRKPGLDDREIPVLYFSFLDVWANEFSGLHSCNGEGKVRSIRTLRKRGADSLLLWCFV